jgi:patatin-like phospholipase
MDSPEQERAGRWDYVLDVGLTLWILRGPLAVVAIGALILLTVPQSQDLLVETATNLGSMVTLLLLLTLVWALPTHYAARLLLATDERFAQRIDDGHRIFLHWLQKWSPRALGALTFVAMIGAAFRSRANVPGVSIASEVRLNLLVLAVLLVAAMVLFLVYAHVRQARIAKLSIVLRMERLADWLLSPFDRFFEPFFLNARSGRAVGHDGSLGPFLLILLFFCFAVLPLLFPFEFALCFPRAAAVPFVMGGWLPLLALLAGLGRRYRMPFITCGLALLELLPFWFDDNYQVRTIKPAEQIKLVMKGSATAGSEATTSRIKLNEAVRLWKLANHCEAAACPRPIIIAAAGGASRAGFFTASVIGQLLDDELKLDQKGHGLSRADVRNRIFALSTVSGSSVGAVMATAALAASQSDTQPCTGTDKLWHSTKPKPDDWRSCLEALMSGDFLTPIFLGFTFHDAFRFLPWEDRGTLLERSLEKQFKSLLKADQPKGSQPRAPQSQVLPCIGDLECPFMTLRPTDQRWLPLLVLNSTSVKTGQRIITTPLDVAFAVTDKDERTGKGIPCPTAPREKENCQVFGHALNFHGLLRTAQPEFDDVRLSTAAHNSARFPLLSPPGEIRSTGGVFVDRIVDGGYFENLGAQTATELAEAIKAIDGRLKPFVLVISNDPRLEEANALQESSKRDRLLLTDVSAPIIAVANTRNARGVLGVAEVTAILDYYQPEVCNLAHIQVQGERDASGGIRDLSWSWWLSKPVQIYLHEQTSAAKDGKLLKGINEAHIRYLLGAFKMPSTADAAGLVGEDLTKCPNE